jgi:hypothetical protein
MSAVATRSRRQQAAPVAAAQARAKQLAYFEARIAARRAADPADDVRTLLRLADQRIQQYDLRGTLSEKHLMLWRMAIARAAGCLEGAKREPTNADGWRKAARAALAEAHVEAHRVRKARGEGR